MFKMVLSVMLAGLLLNMIGVSPAYARSQAEASVSAAETVKKQVRDLEFGEAPRVEIKLRNGKKLKGRIRVAGEDSFVLTDVKTGAAVSVDYAEVARISSDRLTAAKVGLNIAKGAAIIGGVALGLTLLALIFVPKT